MEDWHLHRASGSTLCCPPSALWFSLKIHRLVMNFDTHVSARVKYQSHKTILQLTPHQIHLAPLAYCQIQGE